MVVVRRQRVKYILLEARRRNYDVAFKYRGADKSLASSHCCRGDLVGRTNFRFFLSVLQKLKQRAEKCSELRGECAG